MESTVASPVTRGEEMVAAGRGVEQNQRAYDDLRAGSYRGGGGGGTAAGMAGSTFVLRLILNVPPKKRCLPDTKKTLPAPSSVMGLSQNRTVGIRDLRSSTEERTYRTHRTFVDRPVAAAPCPPPPPNAACVAQGES